MNPKDLMKMGFASLSNHNTFEGSSSGDECSSSMDSSDASVVGLLSAAKKDLLGKRSHSGSLGMPSFKNKDTCVAMDLESESNHNLHDAGKKLSGRNSKRSGTPS